MNDLFIPLAAIVGLAVGVVLALWLTRGKAAAQTEAAVAKAEATSQSELAQLRERARAADEIRRTEQSGAEESRRQAETYRNDLDAARDEIAKLTERAGRVPVLDAEVVRLSTLLAEQSDKVLHLSSEAAQKAQANLSLADQVKELEAQRTETALRIEQTTSLLNSANERRAALEEQCARLPQLEKETTDATRLANVQTEQLAELRELASADSARLTAEREAHGLVRSELAEAKRGKDAADSDVVRVTKVLTDLREASQSEISTLTTSLAAEREAHGLVRNELVELKRGKETSDLEVARVGKALTDLRESSQSEISTLTAGLSAERDAHGLVRDELRTAKGRREAADAEVARLNTELTDLRARSGAEQASAAEKLALLMQAKEALTDQFKALANEILEEKSKRFAEQNQVTLGQLLDPLRTQLHEFKGKVEEVYVNEGKDRSALAEQVRQLVGLNQALSQDAKNLTTALRGSSKAQGNWGELVLERVLEASGLRKGHEYHVQESQLREDGSRAQADVVINLPEERRLVVDAKVSLVAYEEHVQAQSDEARTIAARRHLESVRGHIKGLSSKQYQSLYGLKSLDFVLMFVPIEPAFMLAVTHDNDLFMEAWDKNVLLVSPSTLLFVVRTVAHLWRQEQQSRNAQDIAKRGAELYDRLVGFVVDLQSVGTKLGQAQEAYESAHKKLVTNKGNVIWQAEKLRGLGVKPSKVLPAVLVDGALDMDDVAAVADLANFAAANTPHSVDAAPLPISGAESH